MIRLSIATPAPRTRLGTIVLQSIVLSSLAGVGCGNLGLFPFFNDDDNGSILAETNLTGDVEELSADTGIPTVLSGSLSGDFEGSYQDQILEVYVDDNGAPIAALSRTEFEIVGDRNGRITSIALIVLLDVLMMTDEDGLPILDEEGMPTVIRFETASNGMIIHATGDFLGMNGQLHANSTVLLGGGSAGLGTLDSVLSFTIEP